MASSVRDQTIADIGRAIRGEDVKLAPQLEAFDVLEAFHQPEKHSRTPDFLVVLSMDRFQRKEVELSFREEGKILQLFALHGPRPDCRNILLKRQLHYSWCLPQGVTCYNLQALWTCDNFLIIKSTEFETPAISGDCGDLKLIPHSCAKVLRPAVDLSVLNEMIEDVRDKAQHALRYLRMQVGLCDTWDSTDDLDRPDDKPQKTNYEPVAGTTDA